MSRQISELEIVLQGLISEHRKLLALVENHETSMKTLDLQGMEKWRSAQESARLNILALENRRKTLVAEISASVRRAPMTLTQIAQTWPKPGAQLLPLREELRRIIQKISTQTQMSGKLAGSLLGHLNTVVRLVTGVAHTAGVYSRHGVAVVGRRIGAMEAVG
jgi:hypothetical protein